MSVFSDTWEATRKYIVPSWIGGGFTQSEKQRVEKSRQLLEQKYKKEDETQKIWNEIKKLKNSSGSSSGQAGENKIIGIFVILISGVLLINLFNK
jgi:hypothetical protein